jgi:hypothetical protein
LDRSPGNGFIRSELTGLDNQVIFPTSIVNTVLMVILFLMPWPGLASAGNRPETHIVMIDDGMFISGTTML